MPNLYAASGIKPIELVLGCLLLFCSKSLDARPSQDELKADFIIQLANGIRWPNPNEIAEYNIGVLDDNKQVLDLLNVAKERHVINGKNFNARSLTDLGEIDDLNIIFVAHSKAHQIHRVAKSVENRRILIISEDAKDQNFVMLNLLSKRDRNTLNFEINKANIIVEGLELKDNLLLLGGTEIDIRILYKQMRIQFESELQKLFEQKETILSQQKEIREQREQVEKLQKNISDMEQQIADKTNREQSLSSDISTNETFIKQQAWQISRQKSQLSKQMDRLQRQTALFYKRSRSLDSLEKSTQEQHSLITAQEEDLFSKELEIRAKERLITIVLIFSSLILVAVFLTFRAYRQKQKTYDDLQIAKDQLVQQEKMAALGVLTAGVAHEINNPMNFIKSGVQIIRQLLPTHEHENSTPAISKTTQNELTKVMSNIEVGVDRATNIVQGLSNISRKEQDKLTACDVHDILESSLTILFHEYKHHIDIKRIYSKKDFVIEGKESRLYQVFTNIMSNAIQAIDKEGTITIRTRVNKSENYGTIAISDTGMGMSHKQLTKIFDPFFTTKDPGKGTGLGLAIAYSIVEEHHGNIRANSAIGEGAEFIVELPLNSTKQ